MKSILGEAMRNLGMKVEEEPPMKYRLDDKEFKSEYEVSQYIEENLDKWVDFYTNDQIEDLKQQVFEDYAEKIEVEE